MKSVFRKFFDWFDPKTFIDTIEEIHAFVEGFAEGFCRGQTFFYPASELLDSLQKEHHYYAAGRAIGLACFIILITGMVVWVIGAIHGA